MLLRGRISLPLRNPSAAVRSAKRDGGIVLFCSGHRSAAAMG